VNIPRSAIVAIVQARLASTRLPGKLLMDLSGKPLLSRVLERVRAAGTIGRIVVATTTAPADEPLRSFLKDQGIELTTGSEEDVLDRFYQAARHVQAQIIVRITPDDPFKDPEIIDRAVAMLLKDPALDYVSNTSCDGSVKATFPEGLDIEAFTMSCLERLWKSAAKPSEREHVTPYLFAHRDEFRSASFGNPEDISHLRWTIDYPQDFEMARQVYARLLKDKPIFLMNDILELLRREPSLASLNAGIKRNEGYERSRRRDADASRLNPR
jgi:spore coat polysaccharide biosynthesis protein SpsF